MARHPKERPSWIDPMNRRDFLRTGATAAAGIPMASAILAACGSSTDGTGSDAPKEVPLARPDAPVTLPLFDTNPAIADGLPSEQGATLKLYNWDQYIWKKVLDDFSAEYDCKVEVSTFNNNDEANSKLRAGQTDFDVYFPAIADLGKYAATELMQPLNHSYIPNLAKNIWPQFSAPDQPFYDMGQLYSVPYTVYRTGIGWRNDLVDPGDTPDAIDNPYDILWNPKYKGKLAMYDDYREGLQLGLLRNGVTDVNTGDPEALAAARDALLETIESTNIALGINIAYEDLPKGVFYATHAWSGDIIAAPWYGKGSYDETAPLLSYWWPEDHRGRIGSDVMVILKQAKNPVLAHQFINYMLDFKVALKNFSWVGYQPPQNEAPPESFKDPKSPAYGLVPPNLLNCVAEPEDFDIGFQSLELSPEVDALWHENWEPVSIG